MNSYIPIDFNFLFLSLITLTLVISGGGRAQEGKMPDFWRYFLKSIVGSAQITFTHIVLIIFDDEPLPAIKNVFTPRRVQVGLDDGFERGLCPASFSLRSGIDRLD